MYEPFIWPGSLGNRYVYVNRSILIGRAVSKSGVQVSYYRQQEYQTKHTYIGLHEHSTIINKSTLTVIIT